MQAEDARSAATRQSLLKQAREIISRVSNSRLQALSSNPCVSQYLTPPLQSASPTLGALLESHGCLTPHPKPRKAAPSPQRRGEKRKASGPLLAVPIASPLAASPQVALQQHINIAKRARAGAQVVRFRCLVCGSGFVEAQTFLRHRQAANCGLVIPALLAQPSKPNAAQQMFQKKATARVMAAHAASFQVTLEPKYGK